MSERPRVGLEARSLSKSYAGTVALSDVSLHVEPGQVHGLVGHNGAGKSTLVSILSGIRRPDRGGLFIDGNPTTFTHPADALRHGVGVLVQDLGLCPSLTVAENLWLYKAGRRRLAPLSRRRMHTDARDALATVGLTVSPERTMRSLPFGDQQLVALARVLQVRARFVLLDEPTSALGPKEAERLFAIIRYLVARNSIGVLFISHRLDEVQAVSDVVTVLRDGRRVTTRPVGQADTTRLVSFMLGDAAAKQVRAGSRPGRRPDQAAVRFSVSGLAGDSAGTIDHLSVRAGEVVGILGLPGSGRSDIMHALAGDTGTVQVDSITVDGTPTRATSWHSRMAGVGLVPADRKAAGIFSSLSVRDNIVLGWHRAGFRYRRRRAEDGVVRTLGERLSIRAPGMSIPVVGLSGGNQQKTVIARSLAGNAGVLLLDEPTNGVDVGGREDIYASLHALAEDGSAIVIGSMEPEELMRLCDRILVVRDGALVEERTRPFDLEDLVHAATTHVAGVEAGSP